MTDMLERRIQQLEVQNAVTRLASAYCRHCDAKSLESLTALFAADADLSIPVFGASASGRAAIGEIFRVQLDAITWSNHWVHEVIVDPLNEQGDRAGGQVTAHAEVVIGETSFVAAVRYVDSYVRDEGAWLFQTRAINFLYYSPMAEIAERLASPLRVATPGGWVAGYEAGQ